jgi:hypothetical protein
MALFSFMMSILSIGVIQIMKLYQADVASRRTQQAARLTMEDITRVARGSTNVTFQDNSFICFDNGGTAIQYVKHADAGNEFALVKSFPTQNCGSAPLPEVNSQYLVRGGANTGNNLHLRQLTARIIRENALQKAPSVEVNLIVTTGDEALIDSSGGTRCRVQTGKEFCSSTNFTNTVTLRGSQ